MLQFPFQGTVADSTATEAVGEAFAASLRRGDRVALYGDLGAGKTTLCRGICRGLGFSEGVHSPTYALVHEYPSEPPVFHVDLYRMRDGTELQELGLDSYAVQQGIVLMEWPERMGPDPTGFQWSVHLTHREDGSRDISISRMPEALHEQAINLP